MAFYQEARKMVIFLFALEFLQILSKSQVCLLGALLAEPVLGILTDAFILRAIRKTYCLYEGKEHHGFYESASTSFTLASSKRVISSGFSFAPVMTRSTALMGQTWASTL